MYVHYGGHSLVKIQFNDNQCQENKPVSNMIDKYCIVNHYLHFLHKLLELTPSPAYYTIMQHMQCIRVVYLSLFIR